MFLVHPLLSAIFVISKVFVEAGVAVIDIFYVFPEIVTSVLPPVPFLE